MANTLYNNSVRGTAASLYLVDEDRQDTIRDTNIRKTSPSAFIMHVRMYHNIISYYITPRSSHHILSHHTTPHYVTSITSTITSHHITLHYITSHHIKSHHIMSYLLRLVDPSCFPLGSSSSKPSHSPVANSVKPKNRTCRGEKEEEDASSKEKEKEKKNAYCTEYEIEKLTTACIPYRVPRSPLKLLGKGSRVLCCTPYLRYIRFILCTSFSFLNPMVNSIKSNNRNLLKKKKRTSSKRRQSSAVRLDLCVVTYKLRVQYTVHASLT